MKAHVAIRMGRKGKASHVLPASANIVAHWSASTLNLTDGASVPTWTDSVNGIVATASATNPIFKANIYGGNPVVRFAGTSNFAIATPGALQTAVDSQIYTVLILYQMSGAGAGYNCLLSAHASGGNAFMYVADNDGAGNRYQRYNMPDAGRGAPINLNQFYTSGNTSQLVYSGITGTPPLERMYMNGGCIQSATTAAPTSSAAAFYIADDATLGRKFIGDIAEIIVWNTALTPVQYMQAHMSICDTYSQPYPFAALNKLVLFDGDSISANHLNGSIEQGYSYKVAQSLTLAYGQYSNVAIAGITANDMTFKGAVEVDAFMPLTSKTNKIAAFEWYNQRGASPTPANNSLAYLSARKAAGNTIVWGTSTDDSADASNETNRDAYNTYFDSNHGSTIMDAYAALHNDTFIGVNSAVTTNPSYFADGLHLTALGATELAGMMTTGLNAIP